MLKTILACLMIFAPAGASAADQWLLMLKDGTTNCGSFMTKGNAYCRYLVGGELCWQKSDVVKATKVEDCSTREVGAGATPEVVRTLKRNSYSHAPRVQSTQSAQTARPGQSTPSGAVRPSGMSKADDAAPSGEKKGKDSGDSAWWYTGGAWNDQSSPSKQEAR